jgi:hypothetical protein
LVSQDIRQWTHFVSKYLVNPLLGMIHVCSRQNVQAISMIYVDQPNDVNNLRYNFASARCHMSP